MERKQVCLGARAQAVKIGWVKFACCSVLSTALKQLSANFWLSGAFILGALRLDEGRAKPLWNIKWLLICITGTVHGNTICCSGTTEEEGGSCWSPGVKFCDLCASAAHLNLWAAISPDEACRKMGKWAEAVSVHWKWRNKPSPSLNIRPFSQHLSQVWAFSPVESSGYFR